jgi:mannosyltransferase OCH1-like enzyme
MFDRFSRGNQRMSNLLIPKVFHQIWLGDKPLPAHFKKFADGWLRKHPAWKMEWWTDKRLPKIINRKAFDQADKMAAKSDILRYEVIWQYGGVYIDADFECLKNIEPLLADVNSFQADEIPDKPCNAILGCVPNDPFYKLMIDRLPASMAGEGDIVAKTGPGFLKTCIQDFLGHHVHVHKDFGGKRWELKGDGGQRLYGFDWSVFYPYHYDEPEKAKGPFPEAYGAHHWTASWWKDGGV